MKINILGSEWTIIERPEAEDKRLDGCDGYCDWTTREIVVEREMQGNLGDSRTKAGITFQLVDCLKTTYSMNGSNTNVNGWRGSTMRTSTMATLLNQLSSDLKSVLKFVNKVTSVGNNSSGLETTSDKLFLLSEIEVFGATQYSYAGEGKQYEYYTAGNSTIKKVNGSAYYWWERSPRSGTADNFCRVDSYGGASRTGASGIDGVSFGFCV